MLTKERIDKIQKRLAKAKEVRWVDAQAAVAVVVLVNSPTFSTRSSGCGVRSKKFRRVKVRRDYIRLSL